MIAKLLELGERVLDWLADLFGVERPDRRPPEDPNEYHTMDGDGPGGAV